MLTKVFKNSDFIAQVFLLVIISVGMFAVAFISPLRESVMGLSFLSIALGENHPIQNELSSVLSWFWVGLTAVLLHFMVINNGLSRRGSFMTVAIFTFLVWQSKTSMVLSPPILVLPAIVLIIQMIFGLAKQTKPQNTVVGLSLLSALMALIYSPMTIVIIIIWLGIVLFNTINLRLIILSLFSFITPFVLVHSILFAMGETALITAFVQSTSEILFARPVYNLSFFLILTTYLLLIVSIPKIYTTRSDHTVDTRRKFNLLLSSIFLTSALLVLFPSSVGGVFILDVIPISILLGFMLQYAKHVFIYEIALLVIVIVSILNNYIFS